MGLAAVGCIVDSCRRCPNCLAGLEKRIVFDQDFVLRVPDGLDLASVAPLLCAGITPYSPLRHWKAGKGQKVGIVGLGGLGHMGVKIAHALGAEVILFTTPPGKRADALRLGASEVVVSRRTSRRPTRGC